MPRQTLPVSSFLRGFLTLSTLIAPILSFPQAIPPAAYWYFHPPLNSDTHVPSSHPQVSILSVSASPQVSILPLPSTNPTMNPPSAPEIRCTPWANWTGGYKEKDCYKALDIFYQRDVIRHMRTLYEFVSRGDRPVGRDAPLWVPRAIVVETCTIAFGMMRDTKGLPLPGEPEGAEYVRTDSSSYWDVYTLARRLIGGCVSTLDEVGWGLVGEDQSIGVFVWGSDSTIQRANFPKAGTNGDVHADVPQNTTALGDAEVLTRATS